MTVEVIARPTTGVFALLRRADLDAKDAAIIAAIARAWSEGRKAPSYGELMEASGIRSKSNLFYRIEGYDWRGFRRVGGGLIERGWLVRGTGLTRWLLRTLRPGPRLAGLDGGWPLERVG